MIARFFIIVIAIIGFSCHHKKINCKKELEKEPYVVRPHLFQLNDSVQKDKTIFMQCGHLDSIDVELAAGSMLGRILMNHPQGKITYNVILKRIEIYKTTPEYKGFRQTNEILKTLEHKMVNLDEFEKDKELFRKIGAQEKDLDEFKEFLISNKISGITYRDAFQRFGEYKKGK
jgi:hypothetical protein